MPRFIDWRRGRPAEIWARAEGYIKNFVKENEIKPLADIYQDPISAVAGGVIIDGMVGEFLNANVSALQTSSRAIRWPFPFPGGLRGPHVHLAGDVYLLNGEQWNNFVKGVKADIISRLDKAEEIGFEDFIGITEAASFLPFGKHSS